MARRNIRSTVCLTIAAMLLLVLAGCSGEQGVVTPVAAGVGEGTPATTQQILVLQGEREILQQKLLRCQQDMNMVARKYGTRDFAHLRELQHKRIADLRLEMERQREQAAGIQTRIDRLERKRSRTANDEQTLTKIRRDLKTARAYEQQKSNLLRTAEHDAAELDRVQQSLDELARQLAFDKALQDSLSQRLDREKAGALLPGK